MFLTSKRKQITEVWSPLCGYRRCLLRSTQLLTVNAGEGSTLREALVTCNRN